MAINKTYKAKVETSIRGGADFRYPILGKLPQGTVVKVIEEGKTGWVKIDRGWVQLTYLEPTTEPLPKPLPPAPDKTDTKSTTININQTYKARFDTTIRTGSSAVFPSNGTLKKDTVVTVFEMGLTGWVRMSEGWVQLMHLEVTEAPPTNIMEPKAPVVTDAPVFGVNLDQNNDDNLDLSMIIDGMDSSGIGGKYSDFNSLLEGSDGDNFNFSVDDFTNKLFTMASVDNINTIEGIHGMPYQFMSSADIKISELESSSKFPYGRTFTEKIINRMPLLLLSPGKPVFLDGFKKGEKANVLEQLINADGEGDLSKILDSNEYGRYYSFRFNYRDYYDYVNGMCWASAIYLGIGGKKFKGVDYKRYDWSKYANSGLKGFFSGAEYVCFYVDSDNQISESFSNSTSESKLDSGLNALSDLGREADFLLGAGAGMRVDIMNEDKFSSNMEEINKFIGEYSNPNHLINKLKTGFVTVAGGGQLIFPEIWRDSSWSKSYDINIKLTSPDGDTESIYRNILVPMWHLLAMALPLQMGHNGFRSPFLVKGFLKGLFHCEMGIITSLSIRKGGEGSWNIDGLPTEVEISFTLKDLYEVMSITKWKDAKLFVNNTQMMDFIANMCGVVINKPDLLRTADMYATLYTQKAVNIPRGISLGISQSISNTLLKVLK